MLVSSVVNDRCMVRYRFCVGVVVVIYNGQLHQFLSITMVSDVPPVSGTYTSERIPLLSSDVCFMIGRVEGCNFVQILTKKGVLYMREIWLRNTTKIS